MAKDPLNDYLDEVKRKDQLPQAVYHRERQRRKNVRSAMFIVGLIMNVIAVNYMTSIDHETTSNGGLILLVTLLMVILFFAWIVVSWKSQLAWEKAEEAKLFRKK